MSARDRGDGLGENESCGFVYMRHPLPLGRQGKYFVLGKKGDVEVCVSGILCMP